MENDIPALIWYGKSYRAAETNRDFARRKALEMLERGVAEGWVDLTAHEHLRLDFEAIREALQ